MICAFFGHKDTPESIRPLLESAVKQIIELYPDTTFYVGNNGNFDRMVLSVLKSLFDSLPTIYPEGIEFVPKKYAISYRNDWIVKKSDMVICYITHNYGGAAKFVEKACKKGKTVCNLANL